MLDLEKLLIVEIIFNHKNTIWFSNWRRISKKLYLRNSAKICQQSLLFDVS